MNSGDDNRTADNSGDDTTEKGTVDNKEDDITDEGWEKTTDSRLALAFSFSALNSLLNPNDAFDDLEYVEYIGIVSDGPQHEVNSFYSKHDIRMDFFPGPDEGKLDGLKRAKSRERFDAQRYFFVGTKKRDEVIAEKAGWEYLDVEEMATEYGWEAK